MDQRRDTHTQIALPAARPGVSQPLHGEIQTTTDPTRIWEKTVQAIHTAAAHAWRSTEEAEASRATGKGTFAANRTILSSEGVLIPLHRSLQRAHRVGCLVLVVLLHAEKRIMQGSPSKLGAGAYLVCSPSCFRRVSRIRQIAYQRWTIIQMLVASQTQIRVAQRSKPWYSQLQPD